MADHYERMHAAWAELQFRERAYETGALQRPPCPPHHDGLKATDHFLAHLEEGMPPGELRRARRLDARRDRWAARFAAVRALWTRRG